MAVLTTAERGGIARVGYLFISVDHEIQPKELEGELAGRKRQFMLYRTEHVERAVPHLGDNVSLDVHLYRYIDQCHPLVTCSGHFLQPRSHRHEPAHPKHLPLHLPPQLPFLPPTAPCSAGPLPSKSPYSYSPHPPVHKDGFLTRPC